MKRTLSRQLGLYLLIGVLCAALDVGFLSAMLSGGMNTTVAISLAFLVALLANYFAHSVFTFTTRPNRRSWVRYLIVVALNYLITLGFVSMSASVFHSIWPGKIVALAAVAVVGFVLSKKWIYQ
jgi:putative flippase GtrA